MKELGTYPKLSKKEETLLRDYRKNVQVRRSKRKTNPPQIKYSVWTHWGPEEEEYLRDQGGILEGES